LKINRLVAGTLALVLIAGLGSPAFAQIDPSTQLNFVADDPLSTPSQVVPDLDCNVDSGDIVAWDISKGQDLIEFQTMVSDLVANGLTVRELNISNDGIPSCVVKLVIESIVPGSCVFTPYPQTEIDLMVNFVNNGGKLLHLGENGSGCLQTTDPVAAAFGAISTAASSNQIFQTAINCEQNSSLLTGVSSWEYSAGTTYTTNDGVVCTTNPFPNGDASLIAKEIGQGCVVISGDSNMLEDSEIVEADNRQLGLNMLLFLNQCNPALVGGEFLPIESTSLLLAGAQSTTWLIPIVLSIVGIGLFVVSRKSENS